MRAGRSGMSSPTFILEQQKLQENLKHFEYIAKETDTQWLYTLKAFDASQGLDIISQSFDGFSIGNSNELKKIDSYPKHIHSYAPAFYDDEVKTLAQQSHTMSFNSLTQWKHYAKECNTYTSLGLRINPKLSIEQPQYCDSNLSRLGINYKIFLEQYDSFENLEGLHFHALCNQNVNALDTLLHHIECNYQALLPKLKWINLGGGQNFTHQDYDTEAFIIRIQTFKKKYPHLALYFEPGTSVIEHCGYFKCTVLDIIDAKIPIVILNTSIEAHLLDVAITKQKPKIKGISQTKTAYEYELTGMSCIAGDVIGRYQFVEPLKVGDEIIFENMLGYAWVKQTSFNGLKEAGFKIV